MLSDTLPGTLDGPQRVLVVSGAAGLGFAIAERFHRADARIHIGDASAERMARALAELPGIHGTVADPADGDDVVSLVEEARDWMGGIDVLVNCIDDSTPTDCAGLEDTSLEQWDDVVGASLRGPFLCSRAVAPTMRDQMAGVIVNVGAHAGSRGLPQRAAFAATRAGLAGLTQATARELGPCSVRCNAVMPGLVSDETGHDLVARRARARGISREAAESELLERVSLRSWVEPAEVAEMVFFLASDAARSVCGQTIGVCGNLEWE